MDDYQQPPLPQEIPAGAFVGFQTASKKAIPPPSATALARARQLLDEDKECAEPPRKRARQEDGELHGIRGYSSADSFSGIATGPPDARLVPAIASGLSTASGKAVPPPSRAARERAMTMLATPPPRAPAAGFESASGRSLPSPSSEAPGRAAAIMSSPSTPSSGFATASGKTVPPPSRAAQEQAAALMTSAASPLTGFATASGKQVAPPSKAAQERAAAIFAAPSTPTSGFATASGKTVAAPSQAARNRVANLFAKPAPSSSPVEPVAVEAFQTPLRTGGFASASGKAAPPISDATRKAAAALFGDASFATPVRNPLQPKPPLGNMATPSVRGKPISITPSLQRRTGVGLSAPKGKGKTGFVSPFKRVSNTAPPRASVPAQAPVHNPIFDLSIPSHRTNYRQAYLKPQYMSTTELEEMDIPPEIWQIDTSNADFYHFATDEGDYGIKQAELELQRCGATPSVKWIKNHWSLILWKLGGVIQAQPSLIDELWTFDEAVKQLKYRYEREISSAQRPLVRRIQEHDSSPSLSMVLCVVAIHRPVAQKNDKGEEVPVLPHLELTDGWYRILAQLDGCLARAVDKGKIAVGRKLGITGAKLDSGADGAEVMDAFDKSRLVLSGNSTSLAKWDAKLGMQKVPFIATLSSLSVDGGIVTMMDVVIDKVFPLAFRNADWNVREGEWDQEEETKRQNKWKETYEAEAQKLQEQMQQNLQRLQDVVGMLQGDGDMEAGPEPDDLEDRFEALLASPSPTLTRTPSSIIPHLARYAQQYLEQESAVQQAETFAALQTTCPARDIRDFRMIRFTDANTQQTPTRIGMLKVWDAKALGAGLEEGKRYMVTNLMPSKNGNWQKRPGSLGEVYLQSRRDTRWQIIE